MNEDQVTIRRVPMRGRTARRPGCPIQYSYGGGSPRPIGILSHHRLPAVSMILLGLLASATHAQWPGFRAVGSRDSLWIMYEAGSPTGPQTRLWSRQIDQGFFRARKSEPQPPGVVAAACCGQDIHLFFADGTHNRVGRRRTSPQLVLPGRAVPLAVAGDTPETTLYAIAELKPAVEPPVASTTRSTTQPRTALPTRGRRAPLPTTHPTSAPEKADRAVRLTTTTATSEPTCAMFRFHRGQWTVVAKMPGAWNAGDDQQMCADGGQIHLFCRPPHADAPVRYFRWSERGWTAPESVPVPEGAALGEAMIVNTYLILIAVKPVAQGRCVVTSMRYTGGKWQASELRPPTDLPIEGPPRRIGIAPYHDSVAMAGTFGRKGSLQVGLWSPMDGTVKEAPKTLPRWPEKTGSTSDPRLPQIIVFAILGAVIALTLWWRQDNLTRPIILPPHLQLADFWRRLLAALIDLIPAIVITAPLWLPAFRQLHHDLMFEELTQSEMAERYAGLAWPWLYTRILYALSCGVTEYRWGTTLGKRAMRLWVAGNDLTAPNLKQVVIRNVLRVIELHPDLIALLVFVLLTRNRQRLGDVLAGTVVIEPITPRQE